MLSKKKWRQYGLPNSKIKGIVVHNTNNQSMSAKEIEDWLENENRKSNGCHFLVDHTEVRKVMPISWSVFNTGMGMGFGNLDCIVIEICSNPSNRLYLQGQAKAIELIRELMKKYNLTKNDIYFHRDFNPTINCPAQILKLYKTKSRFLSLLERSDNENIE